MKFVIAEPANKMSVGDLFYSAPRKSEIDKAYDELIQICLRRADREFPSSRISGAQRNDSAG